MPVNRRKFLASTSATVVGAAAAARAESKPAPSARGRKRAGKKIILTDDAPRPAGPYNQAIVAGNTIYVAGQVPINPRTGKPAEGSFDKQAELVFDNIQAILKAAGATFANVIKVNVYLADLGNFAKLNEVYKRYFPEGRYPARTTVGAQLLGEFPIEVDCIATL